MREAPSVEVVVTRFGVWRVVLWWSGGSTVASSMLWLFQRVMPATPLVWCVAVLASVLALWMVLALGRSVRPFILHWDSQRWSVALDDPTGAGKAHRSPVTQATGPRQCRPFPFERSMQGDMSVVIDFGSWMLLRLDRPPFFHEPETANASTDVNLHHTDPTNRSAARRLWLPLQRAGLEPQWHALRCALYSRTAQNLEASRLLNTQPFA